MSKQAFKKQLTDLVRYAYDNQVELVRKFRPDLAGGAYDLPNLDLFAIGRRRCVLQFIDDEDPRTYKFSISVDDYLDWYYSRTESSGDGFDITDYEFSDKLICCFDANDSEIGIDVLVGGSVHEVSIKKEDVEALAKHFKIIK